MPTEAQLKEVLADLYAIDPGLAAHETDLRALVSELLDARPDTRFDERFARELKEKLLLRLAEHESRRPWFAALLRPRILAPVGALVLLVAVAASIQTGPLMTSDRLAMNGFGMAPSLAPGAFGSLALPAGGLGSESARSFRPQSGGGGAAAAVPAPAAMEAAAGDAKMIAPGEWRPTYLKYSYQGEAFELPQGAIDVFRRVRGAGAPLPAGLERLSGGLIDFGRFSGQLDTFTINEDRAFGYSLSVALGEGSASVAQNWPKWPHPELSCRDEACWSQYRLRAEDVPADADLIAAAERFLSDYGIDRSAYGDPAVQDEWRVQYLRAEDASQAYVPESVSIVFPVVIDGRPAYDEGGNPAGLYVTYSVRHRRVDGVWNLTSLRMERSSYEAVADTGTILKIAERGGLYGPSVYEQGAEVLGAALGTPERVLFRTYVQNPDGLGSSELYVPALRFPVVSAPTRPDVYVPKAIVIPLAAELLSSAGAPIGIPRPMPLMETK